MSRVSVVVFEHDLYDMVDFNVHAVSNDVVQDFGHSVLVVFFLFMDLVHIILGAVV